MTDHEFTEFDRKQKIQSVIRQYGEDAFYMSFSGGRDSTVLSAFMDICLPGNKIPRVFADTGIEMNEIVKFVKQKAAEDERIVIIKPSVKIKQALERDGYPFKSKEFSRNWLVFSRHGASRRTVSWYLSDGSGRFGCPSMLRYMFTDEFRGKTNFMISDKCCVNMKENPLSEYGRKTGRAPIMGLLAEEGGRRAKYTGCIYFDSHNKVRTFSPFRPVSNDFLDYLIDKYNIKLCRLYYPPFNFKRTGCKGCPFAVDLQHNLDMLHKFFPAEERQAEAIWKPVYDEYRRIGYRLKPKTGQMDIWDYQTEQVKEN